MQIIDKIIKDNRNGKAVAIPSICSAHPSVLKASLLLAKMQNKPLLVEATSNQVNQYGGYTGMTPVDFIEFVYDICDDIGLAHDMVIFGGDHLGPQAWRAEPAEIAMEKAIILVTDYVQAGFRKIHLDCSEGCKGEPAQVGDDLAASRAAVLAKACENAISDPENLRYIVGTEVPPPGGARAEDDEMSVVPTLPEHAKITIVKHQQAFEALGIAQVWPKTIGLVLQPGLEFAPDHIFPFDMAQPNQLSAILAGHNGLCFEAHSTDYQNSAVYADIAKRNFAIHKVGPALTFAYRKAIYGLVAVENWLDTKPSQQVPEVMETLMLENSQYWLNHYQGDEQNLKALRHFGYADRIRYYWTQDAAKSSVISLMKNLDCPKPVASLLGQYFPADIVSLASGLENEDVSWAEALIIAEIQHALMPYFEVYSV
ncbi:MAG: class II D-tagatose-bisphosphate aldolase, non-catalytic subunit [Rhizobiales bacterium]|nr:class II D-tagatose-bisphosphate aldolase, non-catalytic subunit [Hyphomicrobiales bacterium]NRB13490.1 class II D-tagatose-bisphosphate aldolase, non-catalytic subunit [Hyphomicrobiales bacterium]